MWMMLVSEKMKGREVGRVGVDFLVMNLVT